MMQLLLTYNKVGTTMALRGRRKEERYPPNIAIYVDLSIDSVYRVFPTLG